MLGSSTPTPRAHMSLYKESLELDVIGSYWGKYNSPNLEKKMALSPQTALNQGEKGCAIADPRPQQKKANFSCLSYFLMSTRGARR